MWNDSNDTIMNIFDAANEGKATFPACCPICQQKAAHIYMHRHDTMHGGVWLWCSSCHSYAHMSGIIPDWWKNPTYTDENMLDSEPEYLDNIAALIDPWVNSILPASDTKDSKNSVCCTNSLSE